MTAYFAETATDLANLALDECGQGTIDDIDEQTSVARLCKRQFRQGRLFLLSIGAWSCAKKRASLAQLVTGPSFKWNYAYQLPEDFLRVWQFGENDYWAYDNGYEIVGKTLETDLTSVNLTYIRDLENVPEMSPHFHQSLITWMAYKMVKRLSGDGGRRQELLGEFQLTIDTALSVDALQLPADEAHGTELLESRI